MARAIGSAKRSSAAVAADTLARDDEDGPVEIALNLAPFLAPYRRNTRLTIRVERLPHRGRLTRGRNNGDRSYSLMPDELDGLSYLPPEGMNEPHTLTVRLINLEGGEGATLAVHDYPIEGKAAEGSAVEKPDAAAKPVSDARNSAELRRLRDELGRLQTELGAREEELEVTRAEFELAEQSRQRVEAELSAARAGREKELRDRLAAVQADAARRLDDAHRAWEAEHAGDSASSTQAVQTALDHARTEWRRETDATIAKAQSTWKAEEAARASAADARFQQQLAAASAEAKTRAERAEADLAKARMAAGSAARGAVEAEVAKAQTAWRAEEAARFTAAESRWRQQFAAVAEEAKARAERAEAELAKTRMAAGTAARSAIETEVAKAQSAWKADEAARFAAAESQWREQSGRALAEAARRGEDADKEAGRLRNELNAARASVTASEAKLARAEVAWKAEEAGRLFTAEARWQQQSAKPLAEMKARAELAETELDKLRSEADTLRNQSSDMESRRLTEGVELTSLRVELATAQAALSKRETELQDARGAADRAWSAMEDSRDIWKREADANLANAEASWKSAEAARIAAAEAQWRDQVAKELSEANARATKAEAELVQVRTESTAIRTASESDADRPGESIVQLRQMLADREAELTQARAAAEKSTPTDTRELAAARAKIAELDKAFEDWKADETPRLAAAETRGHNHSVKMLAEAQGKQKLAEKALAHLQSQVEKLRERTDDAELFRLRDQVATFEAALAERDIELVQARAEANQARDRWARESQAKQEKLDQAEVEQRNKQSHKLVRDIAIVAVLALAAIVLYPRVEPVFVYGWIPNLEALATGRNVSLSDFTRAPSAAPAAAVKPAATPAAPPQPTTVALRAANVRSDPSTSASVIAKLPRGVQVTLMERRGSWVHVAIAAGGGKTQDGWVYRTFLADSAASSATGN
jgi:hypothetical protein